MKIDYEKYKDIKIDKEKFKDIPTNVEHLRNCLAICYVLMEDKDKEIERLQKILRTKTRLHRKRKAKLIKLRKEITNKQKRLELLNSIIKEVREYIEKDTRWFDSEYAKTYGELCTCKGANSNRLEVLVNPSNLLGILDTAGSENNGS